MGFLLQGMAGKLAKQAQLLAPQTVRQQQALSHAVLSLVCAATKCKHSTRRCHAVSVLVLVLRLLDRGDPHNISAGGLHGDQGQRSPRQHALTTPLLPNL